MGKKRILLKYRINLSLIRRQIRNILSLKENFARIRGRKASQNPQRRCLAAARRSKQRNKLVFLNL